MDYVYCTQHTEAHCHKAGRGYTNPGGSDGGHSRKGVHGASGHGTPCKLRKSVFQVTEIKDYLTRPKRKMLTLVMYPWYLHHQQTITMHWILTLMMLMTLTAISRISMRKYQSLHLLLILMHL